MRKTLDLPERPCDCGCGLSFKPVRRDQRFFNGEHRKLFHAEEMVAVRRSDLEVPLRIVAHFLVEFKEQNPQPCYQDRLALVRLTAALEKKK